MAGRKWTNKEDSVLRKYYDFRTPLKCVEILKRNGFKDRTIPGVRQRARTLKIQSQAKEAGITVPEFCEITNANHSSVLLSIKKGKINCSKNGRNEYIIPIDEFDRIVEDYKIFYSDEYIKCTKASEILGFSKYFLKNAAEHGVASCVKANGHWFIHKDLFKKLKQYMIENESTRMNWVDFNERICCD